MAKCFKCGKEKKKGLSGQAGFMCLECYDKIPAISTFILPGINKKGNLVGWVFFLIAFIFIWATWLGAELQRLGTEAITTQGLTGVEAMFYANLNLWIGLALAISTFLYIYFGGRTA